MGAAVPGQVHQRVVGEEVPVAGDRVDRGAYPDVVDHGLARTVQGQEQIARLTLAVGDEGGAPFPGSEEVHPRPGGRVGPEEGGDPVAVGGESIAELGVGHPQRGSGDPFDHHLQASHGEQPQVDDHRGAVALRGTQDQGLSPFDEKPLGVGGARAVPFDGDVGGADERGVRQDHEVAPGGILAQRRPGEFLDVGLPVLFFSVHGSDTRKPC